MGTINDNVRDWLIEKLDEPEYTNLTINDMLSRIGEVLVEE